MEKSHGIFTLGFIQSCLANASLLSVVTVALRGLHSLALGIGTPWYGDPLVWRPLGYGDLLAWDLLGQGPCEHKTPWAWGLLGYGDFLGMWMFWVWGPLVYWDPFDTGPLGMRSS